MTRRKICVVTGSRADYGLVYWLMKEITADPDLQLQLAVTGAHLSGAFGATVKVILADGFSVDARVEMLLASDTPTGVTKSLGLGVIGFADALERLRPDILVLPGDRFEILAAAQAALIARIPVAHIAGGDTTEGAFDESIRHSITKMSHLHFVTNAAAAQRVRQMGEVPRHIHNVGSPSLDFLARTRMLSREELETELGFRFLDKNLLVTFHPATLDAVDAATQVRQLLTALDELGGQTGILFTLSNADTEGQSINTLIQQFVAIHPNACAYASLGQVRYLSAMAQVDAVVGNSSSGLYEAPSFRKPTVNIGDRQKGRLQAASIINCPAEAQAILESIRKAFVLDCTATANPYGDGNSSSRIKEILKNLANPSQLLKKPFMDLTSSHD